MKTLQLSIALSIVFHLIAWAIGIINLNPKDYSETWLHLETGAQALMNLIPSMGGTMIILGPKLMQWIDKKIEED